MERKCYAILENADGTVDVLLRPLVSRFDTPTGPEYDVELYIVRGVVPWDGIENDIVSRFNDWRESAEIIIL